MNILQKIQLTSLSKRFKGEWLFKSLDHTFTPGDKIAILGPNGSGKSTLLKIISGYMGPSEGQINWFEEKIIEAENWHKYYSYCAPYQELIEEFTLQESVDFHFALKPLREDVEIDAWLEETNLSIHTNKPISRFSSGMQQRLKLLLAMATDSDVYFLDEPCTNLDAVGTKWYNAKVSELPKASMLIIASNSPNEYEICSQNIQLNKP